MTDPFDGFSLFFLRDGWTQIDIEDGVIVLAVPKEFADQVDDRLWTQVK